MHFLEHGVVILGNSPTQYQPIDLFMEDDSLGKNRDNNRWSEFNIFGTKCRLL
jgi:hypothetical protein